MQAQSNSVGHVSQGGPSEETPSYNVGNASSILSSSSLSPTVQGTHEVRKHNIFRHGPCMYRIKIPYLLSPLVQEKHEVENIVFFRSCKGRQHMERGAGGWTGPIATFMGRCMVCANDDEVGGRGRMAMSARVRMSPESPMGERPRGSRVIQCQNFEKQSGLYAHGGDDVGYATILHYI
jgi:hypothetical protein